MFVSFLSGEFYELCLNTHAACWPAFRGKYSTFFFVTSMSFCCISITALIAADARDVPVIFMCRSDIAEKRGNNASCLLTSYRFMTK